MSIFFRKLFRLYPGEEKQASLFALLAFLWAFGITCGGKFADAFFLLRVGADSLPLAYTLTAGGLLCAASFLLYAYHVFSTYRIFWTVILTAATFYFFVYLCVIAGIGSEGKTLWLVLKVVGYLFFAIVITCFWLFVDEYYQLQDAKRLFSLFTSFLFMGVGSTGFLMRSGTMELQHIFILVVALLILTAFLITYIYRTVPAVYEEGEQEITAPSEQQSLRFLLHSVLTSPFTLLLMTGNFLVQLLMVITEFNYMKAFQDYFEVRGEFFAQDDTEAALTLFLGQWLACVSVANLIFGLFFYSRLVRRFGVSSMVMCTPFLLFISFSGELSSTALLFPLIGLFVVEGTLIVIDDNNFSLLLNAVPSKVKSKIRVMIESFFEPIGMLISGALLSLTPSNSKFLGLILSVAAVGVTLGLRSRYLQALFWNLADNAIHFQRSIQDWLWGMKTKEQKASEHHLLAILKLGDDRAQIFACEGLLAFEDFSLLAKLLDYLNEASVNVKMAFLDLLDQTPFVTEGRVLDHLSSWLRDEYDPRLAAMIYFYLSKQGLWHPDKASVELNSPNLLLRGAAILALKKSWAPQSPSDAAYHRTVAAQHLEMLLDSPHEEEICIGLMVLGGEPLPSNVDMLIPFLKHAKVKVARRAALALSKIIDKQSLRHAPTLVSQLTFSSDFELRQACLIALGRVMDSTLVRDVIIASLHFRPAERRLVEAMIIKIGLRNVPVLLAITKDTSLHDRCRTLAGKILARLALPQLQANIYEIIRQEIERAHFYFFHHHRIANQYPGLDLRDLRGALLTGYESAIDFIIQILGAAGSIEDSELLSRSLRSRQPKVRGQAVETLEKTCDPKIFRLLHPLVADVPLEEKIYPYEHGGGELLSLTALLDKMEESASRADRFLAAAMKHRLNIPNWRESLRKQMASNEEIFHHFAYELLEI